MRQLKSFGAFWYDFIVGDDWQVAALIVAGLACDDGVGAHYIDDSLAEMIADHPGGRGYRVTPDEAGGSDETEIPVRFLGA